MSRRPIGYYVHHQGAGHWQRACLIAAHLDRPVTLIGTFGEIETGGAPGAVLDLPDDRLTGFDGRDGEAERPQALHYAPLGADAIRARMARLAAWIGASDPVLMIVDVSVEIALFARLMSVPTLTVRLAGNRTDTPHLEAFRGAKKVLAFFPPALEAAGTPDWVRSKTLYAGFVSAGSATGRSEPEDGSIVVIYGRGGEGGGLGDLAAAARMVPDRTWHVLGPVRETDATVLTRLPANLHCHGWVADPAPFLARAALVIGGGGDGVVAGVAASAKRFVCLSEARAFDEQVTKADALHAMGAAIHRRDWPAAAEWPGLVRAGLALDPAVIGALVQPDSARRAAGLIAAEANRIEGLRRS
ncbi:glycosyltransferase [Methylobacterium sp. BTF04]|uniref:glycosyltransferase n=1 Tax=Methylobacterium sp. BTF04 TaxID=2708300 RepID=UPI0013D49CD6|nr:glycosyltransferase [Methylobacterium sp. BTF04]NEU13062.1 glycosyltransferase [Methylobacterium sp. BTF04]